MPARMSLEATMTERQFSGTFHDAVKTPITNRLMSNSAFHIMEGIHANSAPQQPSFSQFAGAKTYISDKIDEGYSEETRSQEGTDSPTRMDFNDGNPLSGHLPPGMSLQDAVLALSESDRKDLAYGILRSLRASSITSVVDQLWPLFHKDPVTYFPPEIMSQVFSYLDPSNLLQAAMVSKAWRMRIIDGRLWKDKFIREGWSLKAEEIDHFVRTQNLSKSIVSSVPHRRTFGHSTEMRSRSSKVIKAKSRQIQRRDRPSIFNTTTGTGRRFSANEHSPTKPISGASFDEDMLDAGDYPPQGNEGDLVDDGQPLEDRDPNDESYSDSSDELQRRESLGAIADQALSLENSLMMPTSSGHSQLNYYWLYKQKRRLEENWNAGRYKSFQLPHRDFPEDAHTECVYTIQHLGRYLVSGSRDRTLRIWDLDTQRLARKPLEGHAGSVLCLQFDDSYDEDIIISGSSDTHVILWRFSTGQMIRQLMNAHRESVLNLRFDKRFLVTCSKDKTIKIWSRNTLVPGDRDYPVKGMKGGGQCPSYIIDSAGIAGALRYGPSAPEHRMSLEPYTHLMTLDLHGAAVNAIQIYENQLVSASGDRCLRLWDIHTGRCINKIEAHSKGIACVQYDGKRIVSGSSDNTIRIWDPITRVEVARLEGHIRLVRTVQAAFVDVPGGRERLKEEAAEVDRQWQMAKEAGKITQPVRGAPRPIPGSRKPNDLRGINAKIPPSGGGSRWSHIVSGSYDETVLVWKKTEDDEWVVGLELRQAEALTAAGPALPSQSEKLQADSVSDHPLSAAQRAPPNPNRRQQLLGQPNVTNWVNQHTNALPAGPFAQQADADAHRAPQSSTAAHGVRPTSILNGGNAQGSQLAHTILQAQATARAAVQATPRPQHPGPRARALPATLSGPGGQPNARVFKLQFDARRIICCSQDPKIVGWDFANDDKDIIEASKFFAAPQ